MNTQDKPAVRGPLEPTVRRRELHEMRVAVGDHKMSSEDAREKYLRACGWQYTCQTPGCYWMWLREVPQVLGKDIKQVAFFRPEDALMFQDNLNAAAHPALEEDFDDA
jgi:hypothetical protein